MMLEITLSEPDDFLKVRETLTHFKELFLLDGKPSNLTVNDLQRRNTIATLLSDWGLVTIVNPDQAKDKAPLRQIKIIPHREKSNWELLPKYSIGNTKSDK